MFTSVVLFRFSVQHNVGQQAAVQQIGSWLRANKIAVSSRALEVYIQIRAGYWTASRAADISTGVYRPTQRHRVSSFSVTPFHLLVSLNGTLLRPCTSL